MRSCKKIIALMLALLTVSLPTLSCAPADNTPDTASSDTIGEMTEKVSDDITTDETETEEATTEPKKAAEKISVSVNSVPLEKFIIVYDSDDNASNTNAKLLKNELRKRTGVTLTVDPDTAEEAEYEIIIGRADRTMESDFYYNEYKYVNKAEVLVSDKKVFFHALNEEALSAAVSTFVEKLDSLMNEGTDTLDLTNDTQLAADVYSSSSIGINRRVKDSDIRIAGNNILFHQKSELEMYSARKEKLLASFVLFDADVLMLQECGYDRAYSPSGTTWHDELDPILSSLGYTQVECELPRTVSENYTPIWFNPSRLELIESKYQLYCSVMHSPDQYLSVSKSYTRAIFKDRNTGETFACISTHFTWAPDNFTPSPAELRLSDAKEVTAEVKELKAKYGADFPIFLMGDLNCSMSDAPYREIATEMKNAKMQVSIRNNVNYSTTHALGAYPLEGGAIDHTLISGSGYKAVQYQQVVNRWTAYTTDHIPLLLDVDFTAD